MSIDSQPAPVLAPHEATESYKRPADESLDVPEEDLRGHKRQRTEEDISPPDALEPSDNAIEGQTPVQPAPAAVEAPPSPVHSHVLPPAQVPAPEPSPTPAGHVEQPLSPLPQEQPEPQSVEPEAPVEQPAPVDHPAPVEQEEPMEMGTPAAEEAVKQEEVAESAPQEPVPEIAAPQEPQIEAATPPVAEQEAPKQELVNGHPHPIQTQPPFQTPEPFSAEHRAHVPAISDDQISPLSNTPAPIPDSHFSPSAPHFQPHSIDTNVDQHMQHEASPFQNQHQDSLAPQTIDPNSISHSPTIDPNAIHQQSVDPNSSGFDAHGSASEDAQGEPAPHIPDDRPMQKEQRKYCSAIIRALKKHRDAHPFLLPVDPVRLNIPTYFTVITQPMDITTVEKRLNASNGPSIYGSPDGAVGYRSVDEFTTDVRLIWANCIKFNGPDNPVSRMAKTMEDVFDKQLKKMPANVVENTSLAHVSQAPKKPSVPTIRRNDAGGDRPKREIKAPDNYEPDDEVINKPRKRKSMAGPSGGAGGSSGNLIDAQLKYCKSIIAECFKKSNYPFTFPFLEPVDPIKLGIPDYHKVVKQPMDLGTIRARLDRGEYRTAQAFEADFRLVIKNCFLYNPPSNPVHGFGRKMEELFESKWHKLPQNVPSYGYGSEYEDGDEIANMEAQLEAMRANLKAMKKSKADSVRPPRPPPQPKAPKPKPAPAAGPSAPRRKPPTGAARPRKSVSSARLQLSSDDDFDLEDGDEYVQEFEEPDLAFNLPVERERAHHGGSTSGPTRSGGGGGGGGGGGHHHQAEHVSFEMKRELANRITNYEQHQLEQVVEIIRASQPHLIDADNEIELDIDQLDQPTLSKLYNFVCKSGNKPKVERRVTASGAKAKKSGRAGTGGLNRKGLDEDVEAQRIADLEAKLNGMPRASIASQGSLPQAGVGNEHAMSSSEEDSSDSDSE